MSGTDEADGIYGAAMYGRGGVQGCVISGSSAGPFVDTSDPHPEPVCI